MTNIFFKLTQQYLLFVTSRPPLFRFFFDYLSPNRALAMLKYIATSVCTVCISSGGHRFIIPVQCFRWAFYISLTKMCHSDRPLHYKEITDKVEHPIKFINTLFSNRINQADLNSRTIDHENRTIPIKSFRNPFKNQQTNSLPSTRIRV